MKYIIIIIYAMVTGSLLDGHLPKPVIALMGISVLILAELILWYR